MTSKESSLEEKPSFLFMKNDSHLHSDSNSQELGSP